MPDDSAKRIEISLRAALIAKSTLEMVNMNPALCRLQLNEVARQIHELDQFLKKG